MHWVNLGLLTGISKSTDSDDGLNRLGSYLGAMAYSPVDKDGNSALSDGDAATAFYLGKRVANVAHSIAS
uniref:hypothetical protein n=1 Tax=Ningiella ruwaisensis TaxID=2364274 RepID=UPI0010A05402|nr:hypothetical protein [Ningiella ruwaisensis]